MLFAYLSDLCVALMLVKLFVSRTWTSYTRTHQLLIEPSAMVLGLLEAGLLETYRVHRNQSCSQVAISIDAR